MKRKVYTDMCGSKHILVEGLGEYTSKEEHDRLVEENKRLRQMLKRLKNECEMFYSEFGEPNNSNFEAAFVEVDDLLSKPGGE